MPLSFYNILILKNIEYKIKFITTKKKYNVYCYYLEIR